MSQLLRHAAQRRSGDRRPLGEGVFVRCDACGGVSPADAHEANLRVCAHCAFHHPLRATERRDLLVDEGSWTECDADLESADPLHFVDNKPYTDRIVAAQKATGLRDAFLSGQARMGGIAVQLGIFAFEFMGGSMGSVVGEKITRLFERSVDTKTPSIICSASGGARMQEGTLSLMQMTKVVAARARLDQVRAPFFSVLLNPTTGGVAASYALLGDINIAEPGARIGFAGPRVIENTIRQPLPEGFQSAEFLLEHGMLDLICPRAELRATLIKLLSLAVS